MNIQNNFRTKIKTLLRGIVDKTKPDSKQSSNHHYILNALIKVDNSKGPDLSTVSRNWLSEEDSSFQHRQYQSYEEYLNHQSSKLEKLDLSEYDSKYRQVLKERVEQSVMFEKGSNVLCLAARIGTEVKAFTDIGAFAVGIDINPGQKNQFVLYGDFHNLQFASESVDYVFTNSLDHGFKLELIISEISRVLKKGGKLILEIVYGSQEESAMKPGNYESLWWDSYKTVVGLIASQGFEVKYESNFTEPWPGKFFIFEKI